MSERQAREMEIYQAASVKFDYYLLGDNKQRREDFSAGAIWSDSHAIPCTKCAELEKRVEALRGSIIAIGTRLLHPWNKPSTWNDCLQDLVTEALESDAVNEKALAEIKAKIGDDK